MKDEAFDGVFAFLLVIMLFGIVFTATSAALWAWNFDWSQKIERPEGQHFCQVCEPDTDHVPYWRCVICDNDSQN